MYPSRFEIHRPANLSEALTLVETFGDTAKLLAGGHSLLPMMKLRLAAPEHLVDLSRVSQLRGIHLDGEDIVIGAMSRHWDVQSSPLLHERLPFLAAVAGEIADPQVRNRGTIGGSLSHADPSADYPAAMLALGARIVCVSKSGEREVPADEWFVGLMSTALDEGEIVREIRISLRCSRWSAAYIKHHHPASRFAMVGVAVVLQLNADEICGAARVGITGVGNFPYRAKVTESCLVGSRLDEPVIESAAADADVDAEEMIPGFQMSVEAKRCLTRAIARKAIVRAAIGNCAA